MQQDMSNMKCMSHVNTRQNWLQTATGWGESNQLIIETKPLPEPMMTSCGLGPWEQMCEIINKITLQPILEDSVFEYIPSA